MMSDAYEFDYEVTGLGEENVEIDPDVIVPTFHGTGALLPTTSFTTTPMGSDLTMYGLGKVSEERRKAIREKNIAFRRRTLKRDIASLNKKYLAAIRRGNTKQALVYGRAIVQLKTKLSTLSGPLTTYGLGRGCRRGPLSGPLTTYGLGEDEEIDFDIFKGVGEDEEIDFDIFKGLGAGQCPQCECDPCICGIGAAEGAFEGVGALPKLSDRTKGIVLGIGLGIFLMMLIRRQ